MAWQIEPSPAQEIAFRTSTVGEVGWMLSHPFVSAADGQQRMLLQTSVQQTGVPLDGHAFPKPTDLHIGYVICVH